MMEEEESDSLIWGESSHEVGVWGDAEGQTVSVHWQICIQQQEKGRKEINPDPICVCVSCLWPVRRWIRVFTGWSGLDKSSQYRHKFVFTKRIQTPASTHISLPNVSTFFRKYWIPFCRYFKMMRPIPYLQQCHARVIILRGLILCIFMWWFTWSYSKILVQIRIYLRTGYQNTMTFLLDFWFSSRFTIHLENKKNKMISAISKKKRERGHLERVMHNRVKYKKG